MVAETWLRLQTANDVLGFDPQTARLVSLRSRFAPDQEFIAAGDEDPVFVLQYLDEARRYRQITSRQAETVTITQGQSASAGRGAETLVATFRRLAGLELHVTIVISASPRDPFSHWSLALQNDAGLCITQVQFPFITGAYHLAGAPGSEALLWPYGPGRLLRAPQPHDLPPDHPHTWQLCPENGDHGHYPGLTFAQFLAYYNDRAGLYLSCLDSAGRLKLIKPVHRGPGLRLGLAHVGDWPTRGERRLEYDVVLGSFQGDWCAAAELYRAWSLQQPWAAHPLHRRRDVPAWLLDSPPHIILRIQGQLDLGPTDPSPAFLPYPRAIPLLERVARRVGAPLVPVIMAWERPGPWIYPDCFPPAGGAESLREFCALARQRGWHVGTFCNGTRWVVGHFWSGYDGEAYFHEHGGEHCICRTAEGQPWPESWDRTWRPSYPCCVAVPQTRQIALDFIRTVVDLGLDWVQFFDQNVGAAAFPCFSADHGHPPVPGLWLTETMTQLLRQIRLLQEAELAQSGGQRPIALSVEAQCNEVLLPYFQITDVRVVPPGHRADRTFVPLFHYLYHEFILIQGGFGTGPEPYHLPIRNAYNLVIGEIPGAVLQDDGRLLNKDTWNWAPYEPYVGSNDDALEQLRTSVALRRGPAKDYLVFGRMLAPAQVEGIATERWQDGGYDHQIPAVFHAAWRAPDGRLGVVLANWTTAPQTVLLRDPRLGERVVLHLAGERVTRLSQIVGVEGVTVTVPPLGSALVEQPTGEERALP